MIEYVDFPRVPNNIVDDILDVVNNSDLLSRRDLQIAAADNVTKEIEKAHASVSFDNNIGIPLSEIDKIYPDSATFLFLDPPAAALEWATKIFGDETYLHIQAMVNGTFVVPHIDENRKYAYNYLIQADPNTSTNFYKPKAEFCHLSATPATVIPYDRLDVISKQIIQKFKWHRFPTNIIHSVENISRPRIALTVSVVK